MSISEGGSTLIYPLAFNWSQAYGAITLNSVSTAPVGSGAGITGVCSGTYDIGASDAPLGYPGVKICGDGTGTTYKSYVEVPWALSATGMLYNIKLSNGHHLTSGLDLTPADLVKIYTGQYTKWSQIPNPHQQVTVNKTIKKYKHVWKKVSKRAWKHHHGKKRKRHHHGHVIYQIQKKKLKKKIHKHVTVNKAITLPSTSITPVYRADGSGDSYAFTNFMSRANSAWNSAYGPTTSFPTGASTNGVGSNGNSGVAHSVLKTNGAIGYVSVYYLLTTLNNFNGVGVATVQNAAGNYEFPNDKNVSAAAASASAPPAQNSGACQNNDTNATTDCFGMVIQYPAAKYASAYPISTYTYAIVPKSGLGSSVSGAVKGFLSYAVDNTYQGQPGGLKMGNSIGYVQLSPALQSYCRTVINTIGS